MLYKGDLSKYGIHIGEVDDDIIEEIVNEVLPKRALNRAVKIITGRDMTEGMIKNKLKGDGYSDEIIEDVLERLRKERLVNDERFVRGFIESKSLKKSKKDIIIALSMKGINPELSERIYDELKNDGDLCEEEELIRKLLDKRHFDYENSDFETRQKEMQYLLRKGFSSDSIRSAMKKE
ncbi:MAG: recombination regulator RecX [Lachnospiraceae bacterium]|nr:recombination regulator RecX [Lachnospiraceae bacterium]